MAVVNGDMDVEDRLSLTLDELICLNRMRNSIKKEEDVEVEEVEADEVEAEEVDLRSSIERNRSSNLSLNTATHNGLEETERLPVHERLGWAYNPRGRINYQRAQRKVHLARNFMNARAQRHRPPRITFNESPSTPSEFIGSMSKVATVKRVSNSVMRRSIIYPRVLGPLRGAYLRHSIRADLNPSTQREMLMIDTQKFRYDIAVLANIDFIDSTPLSTCVRFATFP